MSGLRESRDNAELSRERVASQLDPPISAKTLERWEAGAKVKRFRLEQLARIYRVPVARLRAARDEEQAA